MAGSAKMLMMVMMGAVMTAVRCYPQAFPQRILDSVTATESFI